MAEAQTVLVDPQLTQFFLKDAAEAGLQSPESFTIISPSSMSAFKAGRDFMLKEGIEQRVLWTIQHQKSKRVFQLVNSRDPQDLKNSVIEIRDVTPQAVPFDAIPMPQGDEMTKVMAAIAVVRALVLGR